MPYIPGSGRIQDVYNSPNVYANNVLIALWQPAGGSGAYSFSGIVPSVEITSLEGTYVQEQLDGDGIDDASTSSYIANKINDGVASGISNGIMTTATTGATTSGPVDSTPPNTTSTATIVSGDWSSFTQDNLPYDTLMLTPKTSLATFTKKASLWGNQPTPFGPNAVQPGKGDNKHIKEQDYFIRGQKAGRITVPQILHNLSNLAANIWEPFKAKYPGAVITNTFRQNKPGGASDQAQHGLGMAMDIQIQGATAQTYYEAACWIRDNLPFDQLLQEKAGNSRWIHVSHYSGFGYQVPKINKVANCIVSPEYSFVPGLSVLS